MSPTVKASSYSDYGLGQMRLHPRFGIEQGKRPDGTLKIRSVDHFSWVAGQRRCKKRRKAASVNGHCVLTEKITHDHVDDIAAGMVELRRRARWVYLFRRDRSFMRVCRRADVVPWLWKLDIDSAFRRIPLSQLDFWAAWIAFLFNGEVSLLSGRWLPWAVFLHICRCTSLVTRRAPSVPLPVCRDGNGWPRWSPSWREQFCA